MTDRQNLQATAYGRLGELQRLNMNLLQAKPKVLNAFNKLNAKTIQILALDEELLKGSGGIKGTYAFSRQTLESGIQRVYGPLVAFAAETNNHEVAEATKRPSSYYKRAGQQILIEHANIFLGLAQQHEAVLVADYGLTADDLTQLDDALKTCSASMAAKNHSSKDLAYDRARLAALFTEAGKLLTALNKQMLVFKETQPEFYAAYLAQKKIGGYGKKKPPQAPEA